MDENQLGVLLENILDKVEAMAEGQRGMAGELKNLAEEQRKMTVDIKKLKSDTQIIKSFVIAIEDGLNDHERRIKTLENKVLENR